MLWSLSYRCYSFWRYLIRSRSFRCCWRLWRFRTGISELWERPVPALWHLAFWCFPVRIGKRSSGWPSWWWSLRPSRQGLWRVSIRCCSFWCLSLWHCGRFRWLWAWWRGLWPFSYKPCPFGCCPLQRCRIWWSGSGSGAGSGSILHQCFPI